MPEDAGSIPAGRAPCGCSSDGRAPERHFGEARSIRVVRFTGLWCNRSIASSNLAGPGANPGEPARSTVAGRSSPVIWRNDGFDSRPRLSGRGAGCASRPRCQAHLLRAEDVPLSTPNRQVAGSNPARGIPCSGSSVVEQFGRRTMTAADLHDRPTGRIETVIGRAPGASREVAGSRPAPSTSTGGVAQCNTPFRTPRPWLTRSRRIAPCGS